MVVNEAEMKVALSEAFDALPRETERYPNGGTSALQTVPRAGGTSVRR